MRRTRRGARLTSDQGIDAGRTARSAPRQRGLTGRLARLIQARAQTEWAGTGDRVWLCRGCL